MRSLEPTVSVSVSKKEVIVVVWRFECSVCRRILPLSQIMRQQQVFSWKREKCGYNHLGISLPRFPVQVFLNIIELDIAKGILSDWSRPHLFVVFCQRILPNFFHDRSIETMTSTRTCSKFFIRFSLTLLLLYYFVGHEVLAFSLVPLLRPRAFASKGRCLCFHPFAIHWRLCVIAWHEAFILSTPFHALSVL